MSSQSWPARARELAEVATHPQSRWRHAVIDTPRHLLVPTWWEIRDGQPVRVDETANPDRWLRSAYRDRTLVTRLGPTHADHAKADDQPEWRPTSSSTVPSLVVQMLRHARVAEGVSVLDVGTGSGYSTALLCHRLGSAQVTTIDVDPYLTAAASQRLDAIGHRPQVITADATGPLPGRYDRIVSMVSVPRIPASWLASLNPGGRLVTTIAGTCLIIGATKREDGSAIGRIERDWAEFMPTRRAGDIDYPPPLLARTAEARDQDGDHVTTGRYPALDVDDNWEVRSILALTVPGVETHYQESGWHRTTWLVHPDGSWARAEGEWTNPPAVHQTGPRRLWDELERILHQRVLGGGLGLFGHPVRIDPDGTCHIQGPWSVTIR